MTSLAAMKTSVSALKVGDVIEFHGVLPSWDDQKERGDSVLDWDHVEQKTPYTVTSIEAKRAQNYSSRRSGARHYVLGLDGRTVTVTSQQKVVVR